MRHVSPTIVISISSILFMGGVLFFPYNPVYAENSRTQSQTKRLNVPLTVADTANVKRSYSTVTSGVPLPRSADIKRKKALRIVNAKGKAIPAQFTVLARWGGKPKDRNKPIKWVLVDFNVKKLAANSKKKFRLQTGKAVRHKKRIHMKKSSEGITVNTGKARFVINKNQFDLFHQVYIDNNKDGKIDDPLLTAEKNSTARITTSDNAYTSENGTIENISIERKGPLHSIVLVKGWHTDTAGNKLLAFTARMHFYAGTSYARVQYSIWNDELMTNEGGQPNLKEFGSPQSLQFDGLSLTMQLNTGQNTAYALGGAAGKSWGGTLSQQAQLYQASSGGPRWNHAPENTQNQFRGFTAAANGTALHGACSEEEPSDNCRALGWADLSSTKGGVAVGVRDFWQNYPKALNVSA
ncbi:MAG TPA: hypothetical protein VJB65_02905, partial [Patescibacteria group bacterium]|nr:hypothetical protein [Patescibacteria group bacterium]